MKTGLIVTVLESLLLVSFLQPFSLAAPTLQANEDAIPSSHVKRDQDLRNTLFGVYNCRVQRSADLVRDKLNVSIIIMHAYSVYINYTKLHTRYLVYVCLIYRL